jgi:hypothetical protein
MKVVTKGLIVFFVIFAIVAGFAGCENPWMKAATAPLYKDKNGNSNGSGGNNGPGENGGSGETDENGGIGGNDDSGEDNGNGENDGNGEGDGNDGDDGDGEGDDGALASFTVTGAGDWEDAFASILDSSETLFTITVTADLSLLPQDLTAPGYTGKTIVLKGNTPSRTVGLASTGSLFTVGEDLTMELENIVVQGRADNTAPLIIVNADGTVRVKTGGKVTGNTYTTTVDRTGGGGIFVDGGTLEIAGGEISGNTTVMNQSAPIVVVGGGIRVKGGTVVMSAGSVKNNTLTNSGSGDRHGWGGGIALDNDNNFTMSGGSIEGNTITVTSTSMCASANGGGVHVDNCSFVMSGGAIRNNTVTSNSSNNWGGATGGGVRVAGSSSSFDMQGGEIYGNICTYNLPSEDLGGYDQGAFGGGVSVIGGTMQKTGGVIYGEDAAGSDINSIPYRNLAQDSGGLVVDGGQAVMYFASTAITAWRDTTADTGDNLDTADPPGTGGWE